MMARPRSAGPEKAYTKFFRVLRAGGRLINFDANWYLYLFDPDAKKAWDRDRQKTKKTVLSGSFFPCLCQNHGIHRQETALKPEVPAGVGYQSA